MIALTPKEWPLAHRFFLVSAAICGLILVFAIPPFQVPDEPAHFYRAYAVSEGQWLGHNEGGVSGAVLPTSLETLVHLADSTRSRSGARFGADFLEAAAEIRLEKDERKLFSFPNTAVYSPIPYLPQAMAMGFGRFFEARPLVLLYLGRLANLALSIVILGWALRILPALKWCCLVISMTPMAIYSRSSLSADPLTYAFALLAIAIIARLAFGTQETEPPRLYRGLLVGAMALCLTKLPFAVLATGLLLIPRSRSAAWQPRILVGCGLATIVATLTAMHVEQPPRPDPRVSPDAQVVQVLAHPFATAGIIVRDYLEHAPRYLSEFIGRLGWLDVPLPLLVRIGILLSIGLLLLVDTSEEVRISSHQRAWLATVCAASLVVVSLSQYVIWTPVGAAYIEGAQGRHFYPVSVFVLWVFHAHRFRVSARARASIVAVSILVSVSSTFWVIAEHYYSAL